MKSRATKHSVIGVVIALLAVITATMINGYLLTGDINLNSFVAAQKSNSALWILNGMPFVFAFWGQYVSTLFAQDVRDLVDDETADLRKKAEALERQAMHDATHDSLTDLPNRILLRDRLEQALIASRRGKRHLALMVLDLDRFKEINDTLGHHNGDRLLKRIAVRLREVVFATDTLARLGGDEYAVLLPSLASPDDVHIVVEKILRSFQTPFLLERMNLDVQASIGVAIAPQHGRDVDTLLQRADVAMYAAKEEKRRYHVYDARMDVHSSRRLSLLTQLRQAMANNDLRLFYQPKISAGTLDVLGVEALVRWEHQEFGIVPPDDFIHLAEQSGLISELSRWVLRTAAEQARVWLTRGQNLNMAINVSPSTLLDPDFPDFLAGVLAAQKLPDGAITIEITESTLVRDPDLALDCLDRLAKMKIAISIDDFGTGYSSLSYLRQIPACELKIDKTFVADMLTNEDDATIVRATIDLAHNLGMKVVAEGIETEEVLTKLKNLNCDTLQGYYFSRPLPIEQFDEWLETWNRPTREVSIA